jgi:hypothetical protein
MACKRECRKGCGGGEGRGREREEGGSGEARERGWERERERGQRLGRVALKLGRSSENMEAEVEGPVFVVDSA